MPCTALSILKIGIVVKVRNGPILPLSLSSTIRTAAHIFLLPEHSIMSTTPEFKPATGPILTGNYIYKGMIFEFNPMGLQTFQVYMLDVTQLN
jgi:hypothetical protein